MKVKTTLTDCSGTWYLDLHISFAELPVPMFDRRQRGPRASDATEAPPCCASVRFIASSPSSALRCPLPFDSKPYTLTHHTATHLDSPKTIPIGNEIAHTNVCKHICP